MNVNIAPGGELSREWFSISQQGSIFIGINVIAHLYGYKP